MSDPYRNRERINTFFLLEFVDWLAQLSLVHLTPDSSYQRKKTVLLLLSAVLETCTDTWSPDRKKGQPPGKTIYFIHVFWLLGQMHNIFTPLYM